ncbi:cupin domain-containing protein [Kitasatospora sp. NPDC048239]|uniref:cupin domain-containing protein n=1 Tax=Kitasatospora sp. NPDC048239 TaxID=3364046 RepID=UPI00371ED523
MILVPAAVPGTAPAFRRLIDPELLPSAHGGLIVETLPPGVRIEQHPSRVAESVTVVLSGRIRSAGRILGPGEGLYHPPGSAGGLTALPGAPAAILTARPRPGTGSPLRTPTPLPTARPETPRPYAVPLAPPPGGGAAEGAAVPGSAGTGVHWLASAETVGARRITVAASTFASGGSHDLHRHAAADEFFLLVSGGGRHLTATGGPHLSRGDLVYLPAGEWHGFQTDRAGPATALHGYLGAPSLERAGYQLRPALPGAA